MRFLMLTQYFPPEIGASQVRLAAVTRELRHLGHEVEVVTAMPNHPQGRIFPGYRGRFSLTEQWEGVRVHRVWLYAAMGAGPRRMLNYGSFALTCLAGLARTRRPDYLFVESPPLFTSVPARVISCLRGVPVIFNVADLWPESVRQLGLMRDGAVLRFAERLERWSYARASFINAVTEGIRTTLIHNRGVPPGKVLFLPNGVDTDLFRPGPPDLQLARQLRLESRKVFLYAGTHGYAHGIEFALRAARILQDEDPAVMLVFVGDGSEKPKLVQMARAMALPNVLFLDAAPPEYVARLYSLATAGLSTLRHSPLFEGTRPVKIFASMACAKPVVYSGRGEGARLIEQAGCGVIVPPEDPVALAGAIRSLLADPFLAEQLGQKGRSYVQAHLSWSALVHDWLEQLGDPARRAVR